jgi:phage replication O-like protein O
MANQPQIEKGYTRIANEILENVAKADINGTQLRLIMVIWRYTYGYRRKEHEIPLTFMAESLNTTKSHVVKELNALIDRKIVNVVGVGQRRGRILSFNKNYDEWLERTAEAEPQPEIPNSGTKKEQEQKKKTARQQKEYAEDNTYYKMALYFFEKVSKVAEEVGLKHLLKKVNLQKWADDFRKLVEIDGVTDKKQIFLLMEWVTQDSFWKKNVLSSRTFREKYLDLAIKMNAAQKPKQQVPIKPKDPRDKEIEFQKFLAEGGDPNDFDWGS